MPCNSNYQQADARERESARVLALLAEVGLGRPHNSYYGDPRTLDEDTAALCAWCKSNSYDVKFKSLELQIWWRDHQRADQERERKSREAERMARLRAAGLAKLTEEERTALGLSATNGGA